MADIIFRCFFIAQFSFLTAIRLYYKRKAGMLKEPLFSKEEDVFFIVFRAVLGLPLLFATAHYCFFPQILGILTVDIPLSLRIAGVFLGCAALGILVWVHKVLGSNFTTSIFVRPDHRFIKTGPYKLVRHPMYLAYFALFCGAFLISGSWLLGISGLGIIVMLMTLRLKREEEILISRFGGNYLQYRENTSKFLPLRIPMGSAKREKIEKNIPLSIPRKRENLSSESRCFRRVASGRFA